MIIPVLEYLKADSELDTLLSSSASDSKIRPEQANLSVDVPYILYSFISDGTTEENLLEGRVEFVCVDESYLNIFYIRERLIELLDKQDKIRNFITSDDYYYYWCKNVDGKDEVKVDLNYFYKRITFSFKYAKK